MFKSTALVAAVVAFVGISPVWAETTGQLTVSGEGSVFAVPDLAVVSVGAMADASTAQEAMDQTSDITSAILARLADAGIEGRDIQTSDLSLNPIWNHRATTDDRPRIEGYQASNRVTVRVRELDALGGVLDALLRDGANQLGGLQFTVSDPEPLLNEARVRAVADARARAELLADAAGVQLGGLISLSETGTPMPRPEMMGMARASDAAVPVAEGETELRAGVTLVYEILSE
ncbi:SIMPL domain-containing protein [Marivita geojedonensis]|uniref:26 kDa periplasmic immunogenic protein n=1 Tax=Marivita geojedonensis TaxID=1123756 RepID=A0A1X4NHS3_9RHOB|nr:SIMPL domain-containing protein [Marivita geojedonensis]OSQ47292.1 hypothetical protein MGEO_16200 [Marivita geojedonensis]PRY76460.1 hypothetical protein CLV76_11180 [Marivita geojedonensis]